VSTPQNPPLLCLPAPRIPASPYPPLRSISQLRCINEDDPSYLLRNRLLRRGEIAALVGNAGLGKSTTATQMSMMWSVGFSVLGLQPLNPMRIVMVQGENDEAEMSMLTRGIRNSLNWDSDRLDMLEANFLMAEVHSGENLMEMLEYYCRQHSPDLVILDPLFVYFSGEVSSSTDFGRFLRGLAALFKRLNVAALLVHHTGKRKGRKSEVDPVYGGIGSSEFANVARVIFTLDHVEQRPDLARLMIGKRSGRSPWTDHLGQRVSQILLQRSRNSNIPFWTHCEGEAIEAGPSPSDRISVAREAILSCLAAGERDRSDLLRAVRQLGVSRESFYQTVRLLQEEGVVVRSERPRPGTRAQIFFRRNEPQPEGAGAAP